MDRGRLYHAKLVLPDSICQDGTINFADGKIQAIDAAEDLQITGTSGEEQNIEWDLGGDLLIPGLIDTHVHGAGGFDVMDGTPESFEALRMALLKEGTTGFLPTTMSSTREELLRVLKNVSFVMNNRQSGLTEAGAEILGVHMEGPFLSLKYKGAQAAGTIWGLDAESGPEFFKQILQDFPDLIRILTFAPERPDAHKLAAVCLANRLIPSVGHSDADYERMQEARRWGIRHVTHAFNAMPGIHHRNPGLLTHALLNDETIIEIIADGVHIHPAVLDLVLRLKPAGLVCLISDGSRAVGMPDGEYELGGQETTVHEGVARLSDGTIAGSAFSLLQGLRILVQSLQYPIQQAVRYVTLNPARLLGVDKRLGSLEVDKDATFIRLSSNLELKQVWFRGKLVVDYD